MRASLSPYSSGSGLDIEVVLRLGVACAPATTGFQGAAVLQQGYWWIGTGPGTTSRSAVKSLA